MALKFLDIYNECAGQPWSMYDNDANSNEDFESALKISINKAANNLWNLKPWIFRLQNKNFETIVGVKKYESPNGIIYNKIIQKQKRFFIKCDGSLLEFLPNYDLLEDKSGKPTGFFVEGEKLYLYPTPDKIYNIEIKYLLLPFALSKIGEFIPEMKEDDDSINISERYETLFKNCLISLSMVYAIADDSDENHSGYMRQYEDAFNIMLDYCNRGLIDRNIIF